MKTLKKSLSIIISAVILISAFSCISVSALYSGDFGYRVLDDGTAELVNIPGESDVKIPERLGGYTVSSITLSSYSVDYWDGISDEKRDRVFSGEYGRVYSLTIPESVKTIAVYSFEDLENLSSINVDENNQYFSSIDGVLYNKDKTKLVYCPRGKEALDFTVPNGVKEIGEKAFEHHSNSYRYSLTSIVMPEGLEKIGDYAFNGDIYLSSVKMPDTVTEIGNGAFQGCWALKEIKLSKNLTKISDNVFYNCKFSSIEIPKSVKSIGSNAFCLAFNMAYPTKNVTINLPEGVERIESEAFSNAKIRNISIPSTVKYIGKDAFLNSGVNEIKVNSNNKAYCSKDNVLYNKDKTEMLYCPIRDYNYSFIVPVSVKKIDENAFSDSKIKSIYISANVSEMDYCGLAKRAKDSNELNNEFNYVTIYGFKGSAAEKYYNEYSTYLVHFKTITKMPEETSKTSESKSKSTTKTTSKKANTLTVKTTAKTIKAKSLKKAKKTVKPLTIKNAKGTVKVTKVKKGTSSKIFSKITVAKKNGAVTFKKGKYKKGTYKVKLKITAAGNKSYKKGAKTVTAKIKIK